MRFGKLSQVQRPYGLASTLSPASGGGGGGDAAPPYPLQITHTLNYAMNLSGGNEVIADADPTLVAVTEPFDLGSVTEVSTEVGAFASPTALLTDAGADHAWALTYDASPANFASGSDGLVDGIGDGSMNLELSGTGITHATSLSPWAGRAWFPSGSSFANLRTPASLALHHGAPRGVAYAFRLVSATDSRSLLSLGTYNDTSSSGFLMVTGGRVVFIDTLWTAGTQLDLGAASDFTGVNTLVVINLIPLPSWYADGLRVDISFLRIGTDGAWQTRTGIQEKRAGTSARRVHIGSHGANMYSSPSMVAYFLAFKGGGTFDSTFLEAFRLLTL